MRRSILALLVIGLFFLSANADSPDTNTTAPLDGFSSSHARVEREWESKFRALPDPQRERDYMQLLSARPHHVGSAYDKQNAEWILSKFKEWGLDAHIETFKVLFPTPKRRLVELLAPTHYLAKLQEPPFAGIPPPISRTSNCDLQRILRDGDVTAPLVYVNYGLPDDYDALDRLGVSVKGAIVIARYGHSWRGIKPKVAAEHGAVGCLIYSDPKDDGYFGGDVFLRARCVPPDGVQRGSLIDFASYPGDPLTPVVETPTTPSA